MGLDFEHDLFAETEGGADGGEDLAGAARADHDQGAVVEDAPAQPLIDPEALDLLEGQFQRAAAQPALLGDDALVGHGKFRGQVIGQGAGKAQ